MVNRHPNICRYLDIALQHISDPVLTAMRRHIIKEETYAFVERVRREVPGIHLRTTLMVGHPGETEEAFEELLAFTKWARFERMGAFAYSEEEGTYSAEAYADDIPEEVKQARLSKLMRVQQRISSEIQEAKVGTVQRVVIDRIEGPPLGRDRRQHPCRKRGYFHRGPGGAAGHGRERLGNRAVLRGEHCQRRRLRPLRYGHQKKRELTNFVIYEQ